MECSCEKSENLRAVNLKIRRKYGNLRRKYKKLLGVAIELTQVLEEYVRGQRTPNVTETLVLCSKIYPSLFNELSARSKEMTIEDVKQQNMEVTEVVEISEKEVDIDKKEESVDVEKEYLEGFSSRPRLSRTPLNAAI